MDDPRFVLLDGGMRFFVDARSVSNDSNRLAGAWHQKAADWQLSQHLKENERLESDLATHLSLFQDVS